MRPWWELFPDVLVEEMDALRDHGITAVRDEAAFQKGILELRLTKDGEWNGAELIAVYPDFYPFFKPEVFTDSFRIDRHQNPIAGNLCLIGRRTSAWTVGETLAGLLQTQLPTLLDYANTSNLEPVLAVEERQGEPASDYYNGASVPDSCVLIDSAWAFPDATSGTFVVRTKPWERGNGPAVVSGYVSEVSAPNGVRLARWVKPRPPTESRTLSGRWIRRGAPILGDIETFVNSLTAEEKEYLYDKGAWPAGKHVTLGAVVYPEEVGHRTYADGWAIIQIEVDKKKRDRNRRGNTVTYVRTERAGLTDLAARMPAVRGLATRCVALFGVGAIGAPAAIELARAGVQKLKLIDHDWMQPSTARRWPLGWSAFGRRKVDVLRERLAKDYPWTEVETSTMRVGAISSADQTERQNLAIEPILAGCDLVLDATAEVGVNQLLSSITQLRGIPYVFANATPGAWGGMVARFQAGGGCWACLREALYGAEPSLTLPPSDPAGLIQPPGCGDETFTGAAFDLAPISSEAVRVVASILASDEGYPATPWEVGLLALRSPAGERIPPSWVGHMIPRREGCQCIPAA